MTCKEKELIVKLISEGKNTVADIRKILPKADLRDITFHHVYENNLIHLEDSVDYMQQPKYKFKDTDAFYLTESGIDLLYKVQKEEKQSNMNKKIFIATVIGVIVSVIGVSISLLK